MPTARRAAFPGCRRVSSAPEVALGGPPAVEALPAVQGQAAGLGLALAVAMQVAAGSPWSEVAVLRPQAMAVAAAKPVSQRAAE